MTVLLYPLCSIFVVTDRPVRLYFIDGANIIHVFSKCKFFANFFSCTMKTYSKTRLLLQVQKRSNQKVRDCQGFKYYLRIC